MREDLMKKELEKEVYFKDPAKEFEYLTKRLEVINGYDNKYFKNQAISNLINRYIRAIASFDDVYEADAYIQVYKDCLIELGADDYSIEEEVENYKKTHNTKEIHKYVSERNNSPKKK